MRIYLSFTFILIFLSVQYSISQNYSFRSVPDWVKPVEIPKESQISKYDIISGYYITLADYQINLEEEAIFNREVISIISYTGITDASQLSISYDTSYQELHIHHLYVWRNGKKIDRTNDLSLEILNNEQNLQQGIYSGLITAYDILNDIRKDDKIDFAYTIYGDNPIFNKEKYLFVPLSMINPVDFYSLKIQFKKNNDYQYSIVGSDDLKIVETLNDEFKLLEIDQRNVKAIEYEDNMPVWATNYNYFILSSFRSWSEVNEWAREVFNLKKKPDLSEVYNEIFDGNETTEEKINKLIDFVQDDIRYMGIESGIGSIKPFHPNKVLKQRFGDCKDKSLLLVSLLKDIGISEAYPALVNSVMNENIEKLYPSNEVFNHCIVNFKYNDKSYWIDPTIGQQGGDFKEIFCFDYGKALVIGKPTDSLIKMNIPNHKSYIYIEDNYNIQSFVEPSQLVIKSVRTGGEADLKRALLEYIPIKDITDQVTNDLKLLFPDVVTTEKVKIDDDLKNNIFTVTYSYDVNNYWIDGDKGNDASTKGYWIFRFEPVMLYQYFKKRGCQERKFDYQIPYPMNLEYKIKMNFPKKLMYMDQTEVFDNNVFYYSEKLTQLSSNTLQLEYVLKTKKNAISAEDFQEVCLEMNKIAEGLPIIIYFYK